MLLSFICLSFFPIIYLALSDPKPARVLLNASLLFSIFLFNYSLIFLIFFNTASNCYQFEVCLPNIFYITSTFWSQNYMVLFGIDSMSLWFILLTTFLLPPSILYSFTLSADKNLQFYLLLLFSLNWILIIFFLTTNILIFYIAFELGLLPIFLLILVWGSRSRKVLASLYFFIYTFFGSIFFLFGIFSLYSVTGSLDLVVLSNFTYNSFIQLWLWPCLAIAMLVKIPMVPFHLWLPEAHVEAPTVGSVYLASVLLKLGSYGFLRVVLPILPYGTIFYAPLMQTLALISIIYCSGIIIRQSDLKKIIAYSSIIHMNLAIFGLFTFNVLTIQGALLLMFGHGLTSGALFFLVGMLYDRYKTKLILYFSGLAVVMPIYAFIFLFFSFCNIGFPGSLNFSSELLLFTGILQYSFLNKTFFFVALISVALFSSVCYSMWLANKLLFGNLKTYFSTNVTFDLNERELLVLAPFIFYIVFFGLNSTILRFTHLGVKALLLLFL